MLEVLGPVVWGWATVCAGSWLPLLVCRWWWGVAVWTGTYSMVMVDWVLSGYPMFGCSIGVLADAVPDICWDPYWWFFPEIIFLAVGPGHVLVDDLRVG